MPPIHRGARPLNLSVAWAVVAVAGAFAGPARAREADAEGAAPPVAPAPADATVGTPPADAAATGAEAQRLLATMLPPRSDSPRDWVAPLEPLHFCGEPRALPPCVPPPPCHPSRPPAPQDLVGVGGVPTCGPIYRGPCAPRSATVHAGPLRWFHTLHDRLFDAFYRPR